jgi:hypothetical protein
VIQLESQEDYDQALMFLFNTFYVKSLKVRIVPKYSFDDYNKETTSLLIDSSYAKRLNELNNEIEMNDSNMAFSLMTCSRCNRSFNSNSYYKHIKVCWRVFQTKRYPFNSRRKRLNREQLLFNIINQQDKQIEENQRRESKWREQSQELRRKLRELREMRQNENFEINEAPSIEFEQRKREKVMLLPRVPFNSREQRLKNLGEIKNIDNSFQRKKNNNKWRQQSQKFRAICKLSRMLRI